MEAALEQLPVELPAEFPAELPAAAPQQAALEQLPAELPAEFPAADTQQDEAGWFVRLLRAMSQTHQFYTAQREETASNYALQR